MADAYTGTGSDVPAGKQRNGFTGELEDAAPLLLAPSPADQRILSAPPHTEPLADLADRVVDNIGKDNAGIDVDSHRGGSLKQDPLPGETPVPFIANNDTPVDEANFVPTQHEDVPSANAQAVLDGQPIESAAQQGPYRGVDTKDYVESLEARKEAEAEGTKPGDLPPVELPTQQGSTESDAEDTTDTPDRTTDDRTGDNAPVENGDEDGYTDSSVPPAGDTTPAEDSERQA